MQDELLKKIQRITSEIPAILVGSGASASLGITSTGELHEYLISSVEIENDDESSLWDQFKQVSASNDLETSLTQVALTKTIENKVVRKTHEAIWTSEKEILKKNLEGTQKLPLTRLYDYLFRSTQKTINVVTTNYDRLAEFSADFGGYAQWTGFSYGHIKYWSEPGKLAISNKGKQLRTVAIYKVHGSLDWFRDDVANLVSLSFPEAVPESLQPVMVTPGLNKYENSFEEPFRSLIAESDKVLQRASAYLCVGYGFNDTHIQQKLVNGVYSKNKPILILARTLSESTKAFVNDERCTDFIAIEKSNHGSKVYCPENKDGILLENESLWDLDTLIKHIT